MTYVRNNLVVDALSMETSNFGLQKQKRFGFLEVIYALGIVDNIPSIHSLILCNHEVQIRGAQVYVLGKQANFLGFINKDLFVVSNLILLMFI